MFAEIHLNPLLEIFIKAKQNFDVFKKKLDAALTFVAKK